MNLFIDFTVELVVGMIGVFAGAALALWADRRAREHQEIEKKAELEQDLANSRQLVISSVVKNASEAKRLSQTLEDELDPYLFQVTLESAVWEATRAQFVRIATVDERVLLARFFDHVRRLNRLIEFHRGVRADLEIGNTVLDSGDRQLLEDLRTRLREVADEVRIDGLVIVSDLGGAMHKRLLGIKSESESASDT
jgi:hypothetical protein